MRSRSNWASPEFGSRRSCRRGRAIPILERHDGGRGDLPRRVSRSAAMASSDHTVGFEPADRLAQDRESVRRRFLSNFQQVVAQLPFAEDLLAGYYFAF